MHNERVSREVRIHPAIQILLVGTALGLLAAVAIPNYVKARVSRSLNTCVDVHLPALQEAKQRWAQATGARAGVNPDPKDLLPYLKDHRWPECPAGGQYELGTPGDRPECSHQEH